MKAPSAAGKAPSQTETRAREPRGVPAPVSRRMINPKLYPATWIRYRLWRFSRPRSQARRMPPGAEAAAPKPQTGQEGDGGCNDLFHVRSLPRMTIGTLQCSGGGVLAGSQP